MTPEEQSSLRKLNNDHLQGKTAQAAKEARAYLRQVNTKGFTDTDAAALHAQRATQALVFTTSQVKEEGHLVRVFPYLLEIAHIIEESYPLAPTEGERAKREAYWIQGFEGRNGYIIALRDVYRAFSLLSAILHDAGLMAITQLVKEKIRAFSQTNPTDREALQFFIQEGTFEEALQSLETYEHSYAKSNPEEAIILRSHVFGKALAVSTSKSWDVARKIFQEFVSIAVQDPHGNGALIARQLAKKTGKEVLKLDERHAKNLRKQLEANPDAYDHHKLTELAGLKV